MRHTTTHLVKTYQTGIGHIDAREGGYLVSFYGRRVAQQLVATIAEARTLLRQMSRDPQLAR